MTDKKESERALAAMIRAAERARARARRFGSTVAIWKDGAVALVDPSTIGADEKEEAPLSSRRVAG